VHVDVAQMPALQKPDLQSPSTPQCLLSAHAAPPIEQLPPQSTSDSLPFCRPSPHDDAWHAPATQLFDWQSAAPLQRWSVPQVLPHGPPQSTSVSLPFRTPSLQLGETQNPPLQTPLTQSLPVVQLYPA
jgi:hypothetical protein